MDASSLPGQTETDTQIIQFAVKLTCLFSDFGRKLENPERTHAETERTFKLHTERFQAWNQTHNRLAVRQQHQLPRLVSYHSF